MPTTPGLALPYPDSDATPDVPYDLQQLAEALEAVIDFTVADLAYFDPAWQPYLNSREEPRVIARGPVGRRLVKLEGTVGRNAALTITAGGVYTFGQLPVGQRPAKVLDFPAPSGVNASGFARVLVLPDGKIQGVWLAAGTFNANGGTGYLSLDGVQFYATQ